MVSKINIGSSNAMVGWPAVAKAHAVVASYCALRFPRRGFTHNANAAKKAASDSEAVASAHAVLARFCALKSPTRHLEELINAAKKSASDCAALANAHAELASP